MHYLVTTFLLIWSRFIFKGLFMRFVAQEKDVKKIMIYGAGASGRMTMQVLARDTRTAYKILCFLDDNPRLQHKSVDGIPIYPSDYLLQELSTRKKADELIVSIQNIEPRRKKAIVEYCLTRDMLVRVVPPLEQWMNGEFSAKQIAPVAIEELLQRDPINLTNAEVSRLVRDKVILVTGAAGSIGSELVKQLGSFDLDPCTPVHPPFVHARVNFTIQDDGLSKAWFGRVYMNPPYGKGMELWMERLKNHGNGAPAQAPHGPFRQIQDILSAKRDLPRDYPRWRHGIETKQAAGQHRFPASGFADNAECTARFKRQVNTIQHLRCAIETIEGQAIISDFQQRRHPRLLRGSRISRKPSPSRLKPSTAR
jgi:hypothetical protein